MSGEETRDQHDHAEEGSTEQPALTRRQFLIGSGVSLVVAGAAGVGGFSAKTAEAAALTPAEQTAQALAERQTPVQPVAPQTKPAAPMAADLPPTQRAVSLNINGRNYDVVVDVRMSLWEVMTYQLGMAGSNVGCDRAQCGACAVLVDSRAVNSCTVLAARLGRGQKIMTVEGLGKGNRVEDLHPIQRAFWQDGGFQCGICTRGFIMATYALLTKNPTPNETEIQDALGGNICRCAEYPKIYESVFRAAEMMRKKA